MRMLNATRSIMLLCGALSLSNCRCGSPSPTTKAVLSAAASVAENPADCTFVSELDSDPSAAIVCKVIQGVVSTVLNATGALKAKAVAPLKSYHAITVPGDARPSVYLREDLWSADVETKVVAGIKAKRGVP